MKKIIGISALALVAVSAFAQEGAAPAAKTVVEADIVGIWTGKIDTSTVSMPRKNGQTLPMDGKLKAQMEKTAFRIEFKADKTYKSSITGTGQAYQSAGTWELKEGKLNLLRTKADGKKTTGDKPQIFTIKPDGKSMSYALTDGGKMMAIFKKYNPK